ncbi:MAG: hypothetical protein A2406_04120 [Candidatus Komeilibacteria bacterium RIFOXYC1_FULL_37_11]|uniref:DUF2268 domain-containing protein n=1 Tax=Candidatus Komeilibacteria bacterium RIFOXYC1_FULL_37_11 TaxID=1798555 RepID=A0A1G2BX08_9BACT|nr:MAG: hypothetical protein A2406_04120 [Candidatus Komeilibacteria bacterium RIFOXYC1_FULL_37_11]OGY95832.1 MAG: hypothetical protein A2611_03600 [Candidatus Komeilibacteria bacterium RIFOXYD1_FULL_37_29]OGY97109.1 MAG: hypothetical protein A2543_01955 [Candidatus Komeilibacteria bacterium RIFOXYD2_FULL_37_8]
MKFVYDKKIDNECHQRINARDDIFGEKIKKDIYPVSDEIVQQFSNKWTSEIEGSFEKGIFEIFNKHIPKDFICYIISSPYSMDIKEGIAISASSLGAMIRMICHEANHYMFRQSNYRDKYFPNMDIEDAKEIFTIVNNIYFKDIMETPDNGWKKFWSQRKGFLQKWQSNNLKQ